MGDSGMSFGYEVSAMVGIALLMLMILFIKNKLFKMIHKANRK